MSSNKDPYKYLWLKRRAAYEERYKKKTPMTQIYDLIASPSFWVCAYFGGIGFSAYSLRDYISLALHFNNDGVVFLMLMLFTALVGFRLIHSCYLANEDYSALKHNPLDIVYFLFIWSFASFGVFYYIFLFIEGIDLRRKLVLVNVVYILMGVVGLVNFLDLRIRRLYKIAEDEIDIEIEKVIQSYNSLCFMLLITGLALLLVCQIYDHREWYFIYPLYFFLMSLPVFNVYTSHLLTRRPKALLWNKNGILDKLIKLEEGEKNGETENFEPGPRVKLVRVPKEDANKIANIVYDHFPYIYDRVFAIYPKGRRRKFLGKMLTFASGLSSFGYLNYYYIIDDSTKKKQVVGLIKFSSISHEIAYFKTLFKIDVFIYFLLRFDLLKLIKTATYSSGIFKNRSYTREDLDIDYLIIYERFRRNGFGTSTLKLINDAYIDNETDQIGYDNIIATVRHYNKNAHSIFKTAGFAPFKDPKYNVTDDIYAKDIELGPLVFYKVNKSISYYNDY